MKQQVGYRLFLSENAKWMYLLFHRASFLKDGFRQELTRCLFIYRLGIMDETPDKAILRARELFSQSGLTLDQLGQRMGHDGIVARKVAWQFLNKVIDPRLSTLRKFAAAVGVSIGELLTDEKKKGRSK
jgi:hypothetical protein